MDVGSGVPAEAEYLEAWAHFVGTMSDLGAEVFNVRRDPASDGYTYSLRKNVVDQERIDAALEQLRRVEIPYVTARLADTDAARRNLELSAAQLHLDGLIAAEHGLVFAVTGIVRDREDSRRISEVINVGDFVDPGEAITAARAIDHEATVSVHGRPYWDSRDPEVVTTPTLHDVAFEVEAGPAQTEYAQHRRHVVDQTERLGAVLSITPDVVATIRQAADDMDAIQLLTQPPHGFSAKQARHVLLNLGLHQLTQKGRAQVTQDRERLTYSYLQEPDPQAALDSKRAAMLASLEVVESLIEVLKEPAAVIAEVAQAATRQDARAALMGSPWNLSEMAAGRVLDLPFGRTTLMSRSELADEAATLRRQIDALGRRDGG